MATAIGSSNPTLADWLKLVDPDDNKSFLPESKILYQTNQILQDATFMEGNLTTGNRTGVMTGLPTVAWRAMGGATTVSKSTEATIDEGLGILSSECRIPKDVADLNGLTEQFIMRKAAPHLEAMNQELASTLFYGDLSSPEEFLGLSSRYSSTSAGNGQNVIKAGGSGNDNTSIWLVGWSPETVWMCFPKGNIHGGMEHIDRGLCDVPDATGLTGGTILAYKQIWDWKVGLVLQDWRYAVRICNIDKSNLVGESSPADLTKFMVSAMHCIPSLDTSRLSFYMNRTVAKMLDIQGINAPTSAGRTTALTTDMIDGKPRHSFRGIPVRICDAILNSESTVS